MLVSDVTVVNKPSVFTRKPSDLGTDRIYAFSVNFADRTTWYHHSVKKEAVVLGVGDGATTTFQFGVDGDAGAVLVDLSHGKITDENDVKNPDGHYRAMGGGYGDSVLFGLSGYVPLILVDGVERAEREFGEPSGGDYTIDYVDKTITFFDPPADQAQIVGTYYYVPTGAPCKVVATPPPGRKYVIDRVELQFTLDTVLTDTIVNNVYVGDYPLRRPTVIKTVQDAINWTNGAHPPIPAHGGPVRGIAQDVLVQRIDYLSGIPVLSSLGMRLMVHLAHSRPFEGTWATVVFYGFDEVEEA